MIRFTNIVDRILSRMLPFLALFFFYASYLGVSMTASGVDVVYYGRGWQGLILVVCGIGTTFGYSRLGVEALFESFGRKPINKKSES